MDGHHPSSSHWRWPQPQALPPQPSSSQSQIPNYPFQNRYLHSPPAFPPPPPQPWQQPFPNYPSNFPIQNPSFFSPTPNPCFPYHHHPFQSPPQPPPPPPQQQQQFSAPAAHSQGRETTVEKVDQAVAKARADLLAAGESVSAWKVSQAALLAVQIDSWSSLGFPMQQVPSLNSLIVTEGKINAFIHCFVAVRRVTSLYELGVEICKNEGIGQFEELGLGPLVRHPLVMHYFSVNLDTTEVLKITTEEIIDLLSKFRSICCNKKINVKDVKVEEFLDFIVEKHSVAGKEKLGIRIQNFGKLCSIIQKARMLEETDIRRHNDGSKPMKKKGDKRPLFSMLKKKLDERFQVISNRVGSFNDEKTGFCGKHTRFESSSSEDDRSNDYTNEDDSDYVTDNHVNFSSQPVKSADRVSSCPYPSATEEMTRLGLKGETKLHMSSSSGSQKHHKSIGSVRKKRRHEELNSVNSAPAKLRKIDNIGLDVLPLENENSTVENGNTNEDDFGSINEDDFSLSNESLRIFITIWKERCRGVSVGQVLKRMIRFYKVRFLKRMRSIYSSYPFIGILNIAVLSIKLGMWDSVYDTVQAISQFDVSKPLISDNCKYESIDVEPSTKDSKVIPEPKAERTLAVSAEDIVKKVAAYLKPDHEVLTVDKSSVEKIFSILRNISNCEHWLAEEFRVKEFRALGYGDFTLFLEKHSSLLLQELCEFLTGDVSVKSPLEVRMTQHQLVLLLSQASNNLWEDKNITKKDVFSLLVRQFPFISFKIVSNGSIKDFLSMAVKDKSFSIPKSVIFSLTLCSTSNAPESSGCSENDQDVRIPESVTSNDAIELLLKAPMLSDLNLWSHWDVRFAPTLGPLLPWLLKEVKTDELLCLVTKDGKVVRIDPSTTVDSFLEAAIQGSSYQTAVKLLSLFSVVGGQKHVPVSLLKCHAQQAFKVILKNSLENVESSGSGSSLFNGKVLCEDEELTSANSSSKSQDISMYATSKFVLDCLCHLPPEIRAFAADILLSGMQSVIKNAASAILRECSQMDQRLMLHEVGLSLGVVEWINDYHAFCSSDVTDIFPSDTSCLKAPGASHSKAPGASHSKASDASCLKASDTSHSKADGYQIKTRLKHKQDVLDKVSTAEGSRDASPKARKKSKKCAHVSEASDDKIGRSGSLHRSEQKKHDDAALVIQAIRRDEFGLDASLSNAESGMLKKQHARLGRALHCLSQELYSQDSHFLLELVQNADDNIYPENVEPTLTFILQDSGIVVLNNEQGFSAENIRALCDIGNSTKKGSNAGYIGQKGIGFKSVFRITDAPEIHSNGFHVKFDISEGQIGFVLPAVIPPCDLALFSRLSSSGIDQLDVNPWNTSIVLPFRSRQSEGNVMKSIMAMFSDLHPSLLLFLHRLRCIKFRNLLEDSLIVMRKEVVGDGIINVSHGKEKMTWFVVSEKLRSDFIRPDVQTTEISVAFTLQESANGGYSPHLSQQPVFAFLPLRTYGLKFILQGNFVLPSSREEVDGSSPWNQWLLSEFPGLFVRAERSFCALPCFKDNPGKAVSAFMSFVPLVGEVHGFFSSLPRLIISKLRMSNCLLLEGHDSQWVPPCKVLRGWNEPARSILPDALLHEHLGLGFLDRQIVLSDALARALGVEEYGPKIIVQILSSLCRSESGLMPMGFSWLSLCLIELYTMLEHFSGRTALESEVGSDVINNLRSIPFIPLSNGTFTAVKEGAIWLHFDTLSSGFDGEHRIESFPKLYSKLRIVSPDLLSASSVDGSHTDLTFSNKLTIMLYKVGVQKLSAHEIIKLHILPALSDESITEKKKKLMTEYVCFIMSHLRSSCSDCHVEREFIMSELRSKAYILTNNGFKRPAEVLIHFSKEFGNPVNVSKLIDSVDMKWHEVDISYLKHPMTKELPSGQTIWREFFQGLGITDFVKVVQVEKTAADLSRALYKSLMLEGDSISLGSIVKDWESTELVDLLSGLSTAGNRKSCEYLLEVLDKLWDSCFSDKATGYCTSESIVGSKPFKSSFISTITDVQWVASTMDDILHYPKDLYHDCDAVRLVLGVSAPYAVPKVKNEKLVSEIGFRTKVTLIDVFEMLKLWRCKTPFMASITQMSKLYTFIWNEVAASKKLAEEFRSEPFIFVPYTSPSRHEDLVSGIFLSLNEVYWCDSTGAMDQMKEMHPQDSSTSVALAPLNKTLCNIYPALREFFIDLCGVHENPPLPAYLQILRQLSRVTLPSQAAKAVFQVLLKWTDGLKSGLGPEDVVYLKKSLKKAEFTVLPTVQDKWVSLHRSFGIVCWCDDKKLKKHFKHVDGIEFLSFGKLSKDEKETLQTKVSILMRTLGIPALSEVVSREAIYYGVADSSFKASLVNWALPYAQRYLCNTHPDKYSQLKQSGFDTLNSLRVVVVEKLFYRNVIKGCGTLSEKRVESTCLLQDNTLYATQDSDAHALFIELSRLLFDGKPELHMANFLHMIITMAESGSSEDQTEFFILNSQKIPRLPDGETVWSLASASSLTENDETIPTDFASRAVNEQSTSTNKRRAPITSNWPPRDWKTAPGFDYARANGFRTQASMLQPGFSSHFIEDEYLNIEETDIAAPLSIDNDWSIEDDSRALTALAVPDSNREPEMTREVDHVGLESVPGIHKSSSSWFHKKDQIRIGTPNAQGSLTGRLGEHLAFKYFVGKAGKEAVDWVNEHKESGLPYDIVVKDKNGSEFIEVKATVSPTKNWLMITPREWHFAVDRGDAFSIAHVVLLKNKVARVSVFKNPVKLLHQRKLQLVIVMPTEPEFSVIS